MPRPPRADEAGGLYHALNRGSLRATIFHKDADFEAFERILHEALQIHQVELYSYQLMPNHYHLVIRPLLDGEMSRFMGWLGGTHTMRFHAHYHTSGMGHLCQQRYKSFPIQADDHFLVVCRYVERNALRAGLVRRAEDWRWGSLWRWLQKPEPEPRLLSPWPRPQLPSWVERVNHASERSRVGSSPVIGPARQATGRHRLGPVDCPPPQIGFNHPPPRPTAGSFPPRTKQRGLTPLISLLWLSTEPAWPL